MCVCVVSSSERCHGGRAEGVRSVGERRNVWQGALVVEPHSNHIHTVSPNPDWNLCLLYHLWRFISCLLSDVSFYLVWESDINDAESVDFQKCNLNRVPYMSVAQNRFMFFRRSHWIWFQSIGTNESEGGFELNSVFLRSTGRFCSRSSWRTIASEETSSRRASHRNSVTPSPKPTWTDCSRWHEPDLNFCFVLLILFF